MLIGSDFRPLLSTTHKLDGLSGLALAVFVIVSAFCIQPLHLPLPRWASKRFGQWATTWRLWDFTTQRRLADIQWHLPLDLRTAPPIGLLVLLAATAADGNTIKRGIVGDESMRPYDVLVLFISLVCCIPHELCPPSLIFFVPRLTSLSLSTAPALSKLSL